MGDIGQLLNSAEGMGDGYLFAMCTDRILFEKWPLTAEQEADFRMGEGKLLEARVFNAEEEWKLFRADIGPELTGPRRLRDEEGLDYFDEEQYLDIDEKRSGELFAEGQMVRATGGGIYHLPFPEYRNIKLRIRNYIAYYEETGQAYVVDWRLCGIFQEERRG